MAQMDDLPTGEVELAAAIRDGHLEENPENTAEVRITNAGLARYLILQPSAEALLAVEGEEEPLDEAVPPIDEPETEPAPPPSDPPELLEP